MTTTNHQALNINPIHPNYCADTLTWTKQSRMEKLQRKAAGIMKF